MQQTATSLRLKRVRFIASMTASGSQVQFQMDPDGSSHWTTMSYTYNLNSDQVTPFQRQNAVFYGAGGLINVTGNDTDVDVAFGQYPTTNAAYAGAASNWASSFTQKWRLAKYRII